MDVMDRIRDQVENHSIVIYMKGTPQLPSCGFSARAAQAMMETGVEFAYVNVLADPEIMQELPNFADWPTFPQIYMNGELFGGGDIIMELYEGDELKDVMQEAFEKGPKKTQ